ncbi:hypothetical protein P168DRAFT_186878 [Aspergillus campestris IBT 28561]|uniref:Uncharacterized protein n=1 Tax=Aspergillus campestris (strain IBT 28561) TaxID=1392248 RepID=A0A2I1CYA2_ASPC2|nr:uncharacterized protein P168DRAFT_186878 [Aspergillus campestris IBT 28561]PKY02594.1 hypothetical protein P168DRAFT_186878 [Aspergillus campestris IBT 28561]
MSSSPVLVFFSTAQPMQQLTGYAAVRASFSIYIKLASTVLWIKCTKKVTPQAPCSDPTRPNLTESGKNGLEIQEIQAVEIKLVMTTERVVYLGWRFPLIFLSLPLL